MFSPPEDGKVKTRQPSLSFPLFASSVLSFSPYLSSRSLFIFLLIFHFFSYFRPLPKLLPPFFLLRASVHVFIWFLHSQGSLSSLAAVCGRTTLTSASFTPPLSPEREGRAGHSTTAVLPDVLQLFLSVVSSSRVL